MELMLALFNIVQGNDFDNYEFGRLRFTANRQFYRLK